jgi:hypothetical protein
VGRRGLPGPRGPVSEQLFDRLVREPHRFGDIALPDVDALGDDDLQLALYCCYELHYRGWPGVSDGWEWNPSLLVLRAELEDAYERRLHEEVPVSATDPAGVVAELWRLATDGDGPSLSRWLSGHGTLLHAREFAIHRSAYQLKEADPHTWAIPRLTGRAKAAMVAIQSDEYGGGVAPRMHASLFSGTMEGLGLDSTYGEYLDLLPGTTLATTNLISLLGLHRRFRGALVGHLALFEMTSVGPMGRYSDWLRGLGVSDAGREFYDVHVEADVVHQHVAADDMVGGLLEAEPDLAASVLFGARALGMIEGRFSAQLLDAWQRGQSSLRTAVRRIAA